MSIVTKDVVASNSTTTYNSFVSNRNSVIGSMALADKIDIREYRGSLYICKLNAQNKITAGAEIVLDFNSDLSNALYGGLGEAEAIRIQSAIIFDMSFEDWTPEIETQVVENLRALVSPTVTDSIIRVLRRSLGSVVIDYEVVFPNDVPLDLIQTASASLGDESTVNAQMGDNLPVRSITPPVIETTTVTPGIVSINVVEGPPMHTNYPANAPYAENTSFNVPGKDWLNIRQWSLSNTTFEGDYFQTTSDAQYVATRSWYLSIPTGVAGRTREGQYSMLHDYTLEYEWKIVSNGPDVGNSDRNVTGYWNFWLENPASTVQLIYKFETNQFAYSGLPVNGTYNHQSFYQTITNELPVNLNDGQFHKITFTKIRQEPGIGIYVDGQLVVDGSAEIIMGTQTKNLANKGLQGFEYGTLQASTTQSKGFKVWIDKGFTSEEMEAGGTSATGESTFTAKIVGSYNEIIAKTVKDEQQTVINQRPDGVYAFNAPPKPFTIQATITDTNGDPVDTLNHTVLAD